MTIESIISVDELQSQGVNASDIQKLKASGICTVSVRCLFFFFDFRFTNKIQTVLSTTRRNLCKIRGLSEVKVEKIKEAAGKLMVCISSLFPTFTNCISLLDLSLVLFKLI